MQEQTGYEPNVYQCHAIDQHGQECGTILSEEQVGTRTINWENEKELFCTQCNSNQVSLVT